MNKELNVHKLFRKAKAAKRSGQYLDARDIYHEILERFPNNVKARREIALLNKENPIPDLIPLLQNEKYEELEQILVANIDRDAGNPNFWKLLGSVYFNLKNNSLSLQCYQKALELDPNDYLLIHQVGCDLLDINDVENAFKAFKYASIFNPDFSSAYTKIGEVYNKILKYDEAVTHWKKALEVNSEDTLALTYLGINAIEAKGDVSMGIDYFTKACEIDPTDAQHFSNLATAYYENAENEKALEIFEAWASKNWNGATDEQRKMFRFNHSLTLFASGNASKAWHYFRDRVYANDVLPVPAQEMGIPRLDNIDDAAGKRIFVAAEQGVGDQIFLLGLLNAFHEKAKCDVLLQVEPRLETLMKRAFPTCEITTNILLENPKADFWIPYGDMGYFLNFNEDNSHLCKPYISNQDHEANDWTELFSREKLNVGFSWRSGLIDPRRLNSYTRLADWTQMLNSEFINLISVQYSDIEEDLKEISDEEKFNLKIPQFDLKNDFEQLTNLMSQCDVVLGPYTAPAIQASALGVKTIIFNLKSGDRWSFGRSLSHKVYQNIWYQNCEHVVFNQSSKSKMTNEVIKILSKLHEEKQNSLN